VLPELFKHLNTPEAVPSLLASRTRRLSEIRKKNQLRRRKKVVRLKED
jgi:hypothetical protein